MKSLQKEESVKLKTVGNLAAEELGPHRGFAEAIPKSFADADRELGKYILYGSASSLYFMAVYVIASSTYAASIHAFEPLHA